MINISKFRHIPEAAYEAMKELKKSNDEKDIELQKKDAEIKSLEAKLLLKESE